MSIEDDPKNGSLQELLIEQWFLGFICDRRLIKPLPRYLEGSSGIGKSFLPMV